MKRIISVIITVLLLSSCLFMSVAADGGKVTFSSNYQKMYYNGYTYSRFNDDYIDYQTTENIDDLVSLNEEQKSMVEIISVDADEGKTVFYACYEYLFDGQRVEATFMRDDCLEELNLILEYGNDKYRVETVYDNDFDSFKTVGRHVLFGEEITIDGNDINDYYFSVPVTAQVYDSEIYASVGQIIYHGIEEEFYYIDFKELGIKKPLEFNVNEAGLFTAHKITDMDLSLDLEKAYNEFYEDDFGFMGDDSFTEAVSNIFMILVFAVIPFAVLVIFSVLTLRAKGIYKKFFAVISVLSAAELVIFAVIVCIL